MRLFALWGDGHLEVGVRARSRRLCETNTEQAALTRALTVAAIRVHRAEARPPPSRC